MKNRIIISDPTFLNNNLKIILNLFVNNGYPKGLLHRVVYSSKMYDGPADDNK